MKTFIIDGPTFDSEFIKILNLGETSGFKPEQWALILKMSADLLMEKMGMAIDSTELIEDPLDSEVH